MSFFGFNPTEPPEKKHNTRAPGFGPTPDPFAALSRGNIDDIDDEALDFEDTYDGLGEDLEEAGDALNDETFGGVGPVSKDFDFAGRGHSLETEEQQQIHQPSRHVRPTEPSGQLSPPKPTSKPAKTGYERYNGRAAAIPDLAASTSIWGQPTQSAQHQRQQAQHGHQPSLATTTKKMMSLEEVEAAMRSQSRQNTLPTPNRFQTQEQSTHTAAPSNVPTIGASDPITRSSFTPGQAQILQRSSQPTDLSHPNARRDEAPTATPLLPTDRTLSGQRSELPSRFPSQTQLETPRPSVQQRQTNHTQISSMSQVPPALQSMPPPRKAHNRGQSFGGRMVSHPDELLQMPEEERAKLLVEDANRAKRNHKIHILSKDNGLMTPQDKNFITRIQLQQLVTATGGVDEQGPDASFAEDFYFQVFSHIRGAPRQEDNFAQTYLSELAWRGRNRRYLRGGENHMRRMEQQVQRAVEAAKARPKNKQLVVEGSLGKISFSNAKTPKPLLNIKRHESQDAHAHSAARVKMQESGTGSKVVLRDIETLYGTLLKMEDDERSMPPPPNEESSGDEIQGHIEWRQRRQELSHKLWNQLKVLEPILPNSPTPHPFLAILSHPKGKKLIPRLFRQVDDQQRLTVLTIIVAQLDQLDVIRLAQPTSNHVQIPSNIEREIELFSQVVMPCMFAYISDVPLGIVIGLLGLITDRTNILCVAQSKTGINFLLMFISRAQMIKQAGGVSDPDLAQWTSTFNTFFDTLEPLLPIAFTRTTGSGNDEYIWQFLAAMGIEASPEQQQRLVIAVKDKVMETVEKAKALPGKAGKPQLDNVNLFMHAIGLDVDLLD